MKRKIVKIDEDLCTGCGDCVGACAEGAIQIVDGVAKLVKEIYCDGLGACLGDCPEDAITIEEREADAFDEKATEEHLARMEAEKAKPAHSHDQPCGCPGSAMRSFEPQPESDGLPVVSGGSAQSALGHWPVQLMLVPPQAPFLAGADILVCADCVPFAVPDFHSKYLNGKAVLVGCPKLDNLPFYEEKLQEIFKVAKPRSITVLKMEVPCCGGIAQVAKKARDVVDPNLPLDVITIGVRGEEKTAADLAPWER
jgi:Pyruvate/2-oxoacid:ferredoxin oxidoreductase delta subunit